MDWDKVAALEYAVLLGIVLGAMFGLMSKRSEESPCAKLARLRRETERVNIDG